MDKYKIMIGDEVINTIEAGQRLTVARKGEIMLEDIHIISGDDSGSDGNND